MDDVLGFEKWWESLNHERFFGASFKTVAFQAWQARAQTRCPFAWVDREWFDKDRDQGPYIESYLTTYKPINEADYVPLYILDDAYG